jgi:hypothetical protein
LGDATGAERVIRFFERVLIHPKPPFAGQPFVLQPWQVSEIIRPIYDPMDANGICSQSGLRMEMASRNCEEGVWMLRV